MHLQPFDVWGLARCEGVVPCSTWLARNRCTVKGDLLRANVGETCNPHHYIAQCITREFRCGGKTTSTCSLYYSQSTQPTPVYLYSEYRICSQFTASYQSIGTTINCYMKGVRYSNYLLKCSTELTAQLHVYVCGYNVVGKSICLEHL